MADGVGGLGGVEMVGGAGGLLCLMAAGTRALCETGGHQNVQLPHAAAAFKEATDAREPHKVQGRLLAAI